MGIKIKLDDRPLKIKLNSLKIKIPTVPDLGPTDPKLYPGSNTPVAKITGLPPVA